jgi:hypothetical protein
MPTTSSSKGTGGQLSKNIFSIMTQATTLKQPPVVAVRIDSVEEVFGILYRVWSGSRLLGTFYQSHNGNWIAQISLPDFTTKKVTCDSYSCAASIFS